LKRRFSKEIIKSLSPEENHHLGRNPNLEKDVHGWVEGTVSSIRLMAPQDPNWSFYEMDEKNFANLVDCYRCIYPEAYQYLEYIKNGLDTEIETLRKISLEHRRKVKMDPYHSKCDGKLLPQIKLNANGKKVKKCSKCHRWIKA
jgi:Zn-finger protein